MQEPLFSQVNLYYNYAFDLGRVVNPIDAARRLLRTSFAGGFCNYTTGQDEIADQHGPSVSRYGSVLSIRETLEQTRPGVGFWLKLLLTSPDMRRGVWQAVRRTYSREALVPDEVEASAEEPISGIDEVSDAAVDFTLTLLGRIAIHKEVDREILYEGYLNKMPFVRVSLQPFTVKFEREAVHFSVSVMIHRSGVAILAAQGHFSHPMMVQEIIELRCTALICGYEIPSALISRYYSLLYKMSKKDLEDFCGELAAAERPQYVHFDEVEEESVWGLLDVYRYSIIEAVQDKQYKSLDALYRSLRSMEYFGYPIVFAQHPEIETVESLKSQYAEPLAKLIVGFRSSSQLKKDFIEEFCKSDLSVTDDESFFLTEASATALYYGESDISDPDSAEWLYEMFTRSVLVDILVLQRVILSIYDTLLRQVPLGASGIARLNKIKRELLLALEEYEVLGLSHHGSVYDAIQRGQEILRIGDMHALFIGRLENIDKLVQGIESERRAKSDSLARLAATVVSSLLSLSVAAKIVEIVQDWAVIPSHPYPSLIRVPFALIVRVVRARPTFWTLLIYMGIFLTTLAIAWGERVFNYLTRKRSAIPSPPPVQSRACPPPPVSLNITTADRTCTSESDTPERN